MSQSLPPPPSGPPPFDPQGPEVGAQQRRRSSLAWKIVLGLLGGGLLLIVVCAGIGFFAFRSAMSVDPAQVREVAQDIAAIQVPDYFKPVMSMSIAGVRMVMFNGADNRGVFALIDTQEEMQDRAAFEAEMRARIGEQVSRQHRFNDGEEIERRTGTFQIKGQPVELQVVKTENADGAVFHEISGSFDGTENMAFIYLKAPDDQLTAADLRQMIESIE